MSHGIAATGGKGPSLQDVSNLSNQFGVKLAKTLAADSAGNVLISPAGLYLALGALYGGSAGTTKTTLEKSLGFYSTGPGTALDSVAELNDAIKRSSVVQVANSLWTGPKFLVGDPYRTQTLNKLGMTCSPLRDLGATGVGQINNWVKESTGGLIPSLITKLDPRTVLVLLDAITFNGQWVTPFDAHQTGPAPFHDSKGSYSKDFMHQTGTFNYASDKTGTQLLSLPYRSGLSMRVVLPRAGVLASKALDYLAAPMLNLSPSRVNLHLPKFGFSTKFDLSSPLSKLGLSPLFKRADLTGISTTLTPDRTHVSEILQKTMVDLDEKGTKAAAATSITIVARAMRRPEATVEMNVDHPFAFAIVDDASGAILFLGTVNDLR